MSNGGVTVRRNGVPSKHCCDAMTFYLQDEDAIIYFWPHVQEYLIPVHDGGASGIVIRFCPWCGTKLPESERDEVLGDPEC